MQISDKPKIHLCTHSHVPICMIAIKSLDLACSTLTLRYSYIAVEVCNRKVIPFPMTLSLSAQGPLDLFDSI